jgi:peptide-methionine (S)-S-oxide reductase
MHRSLIRSIGLITLPLLALVLLAARFSGAAPERRQMAALPVPSASQRVATFAGGCFWSMQKAFDGVTGVASVTAGYSGGSEADPDYQLVETGNTRYAESVQVIYDPATISYERLLDVYWHHIDPLTVNQAFCDRGPQYRSIIFYRDAEQQRLAEASKQALDHRFDKPIVTAIQPASRFYPAEEYHQQYYRKNPARYQAYVIGCGRNERIKQLWGDDRQSQVTSRESGAAK